MQWLVSLDNDFIRKLSLGRNVKMHCRIKYPNRLRAVLIWIAVISVPEFLSESLPDTKSPESISYAADAIGMYLKKIANDELFVLKMQEIYDSDHHLHQNLRKTNGT